MTVITRIGPLHERHDFTNGIGGSTELTTISQKAQDTFLNRFLHRSVYGEYGHPVQPKWQTRDFFERRFMVFDEESICLRLTGLSFESDSIMTVKFEFFGVLGSIARLAYESEEASLGIRCKKRYLPDRKEGSEIEYIVGFDLIPKLPISQ